MSEGTQVDTPEETDDPHQTGNYVNTPEAGDHPGGGVSADTSNDADLYRPVTGGELYGLWRNANEVLPKVESVYKRLDPEIDAVEGATELNHFGSSGNLIHSCALRYAIVLSRTHRSLSEAGDTLNEALADYTRVDGTTGGELNKAGEKLERILRDQNATPFDPDSSAK